jgi:hypothetical protein
MIKQFIALILVSLAWGGGQGLKQDFEAGLGEWKTQGDVSLVQHPEGGSYAQIRTEVKTGTARLFSPNLPLGEAKGLSVAFRYRSTVPRSSMHVGSWICVVFFDKDMKSLGDAGILAVLAPLSSEWKSVSETLACPAGAAFVTVQPRLQQSEGRFDLDDFSATPGGARPAQEAAPAAKPAASDPTSAFRTLESYELEKGDTVVLRGRQGALANERKGEGNALPWVFTLPDRYCENPDLVYEVAATFVPAWSTRGESDPHGVFALGANILGQDTNSFTIMLWSGNNLIMRALPNMLGARAEVRQPVVIEAGKERSVRALLSARELTAWLDGGLFGQAPSTRDFSWPKGRPFVIGGERVNSAPLKGEIKSFKIAIHEPLIRAVFAGGADFGYFTGAGPHAVDLALSGGIAGAAMSAIVVLDTEGKVVANLAPKERMGDRHRYVLPALPWGSYRLATEVSFQQAKKAFSRSIVVIPRAVEREPAEKSIFGMTHEYPTFPDTVNPELIETAFGRMAALGIRWFRVWATWDQVETTRGTYDWRGVDALVAAAKKHGIELYVCLHGGAKDFMIGKREDRRKFDFIFAGPMFEPLIDVPAWLKWVQAYAARYKDTITYYQIWNEPDSRKYFWPFTPEAYIAFMRDGGAAVKAGNPKARIALGGFCAALEDTFFDRMTHTDKDSAYGLKEFYQHKPQPYFEIFDYHFYTPGEAGQSWDSRTLLVKRLRDYLATQGDGHKPIWNGETGFASTGIPERVGKMGSVFNVPLLSEREHGVRIVQWHVQSKALGIERNFNYLFNSDTFGPVNEDFSPKPAYAAQAQLAILLGGSAFDREIQVHPSIRAYAFKGPGGYTTWLWTRSGSEILALGGAGENPRALDLYGNALPWTGVLKVAEEPVALRTAAIPTIAPLVRVSVPDGIVSGEAFTVRVALRNPSSGKCEVSFGASIAGGAPIRRSVNLAAGESREERIELPGVEGRVLVEGAIRGAIAQPFLFEKKIAPRPSMILTEGGEARFAIDAERQVAVGAKVLDAQARTVVECQWKGPGDASMKGALVRRGATIAFTMEVVDDRVLPSEGALYNGDAIEIFLDLRTDEMKKAKNMEGVHQVVVSAGGKIWWARNKPIPGFQVQAAKTATGWKASGSFPTPALERFGFDVSLDDGDDAAGRRTQLVWAGGGDNHMNPDGYGRVILK